jgi:hypothetical protein
MASTNGVIFPESMADILANPVDICFGSMLAKSTAPTACLIIKGNTVTTDQQIGTDLLTETHPPSSSDLIVVLPFGISAKIILSTSTTPRSPTLGATARSNEPTTWSFRLSKIVSTTTPPTTPLGG